MGEKYFYLEDGSRYEWDECRVPFGVTECRKCAESRYNVSVKYKYLYLFFDTDGSYKIYKKIEMLNIVCSKCGFGWKEFTKDHEDK